MNNKWNALIKKGALLLLLGTTLFGGCAQEPIHPDGQALLKEGRYEEALAKMDGDAKAHPNDMNYRIAYLRTQELVIEQLLTDAGNARAAGHRDDAQVTYERILGIDPNNNRAQDGLETLAKDKQHDKMLAEADGLMKRGELDAAEIDVKAVLLENPKDSKALLLKHQIEDQQTKDRMAVPSLKSVFKKPVSLQFRDANIKMVFEALSRMSGINILLDKDVRPDLKTSIFVKNVSVEDTIDLILFQSQLDKKILSDNTIFVYPNTPNKIKEYQDLVIRSFHLVNAEPKQMLTMLKTVLKTKDIFINDKTNSIVMRDTPAAVSLAEKMIADQDVPDPEVMMEVEVLEVNRTRLTDLGIKWPDSLILTSPTNVAAAQSVTICTSPAPLRAAPIPARTVLHLVRSGIAAAARSPKEMPAISSRRPPPPVSTRTAIALPFRSR